MITTQSQLQLPSIVKILAFIQVNSYFREYLYCFINILCLAEKVMWSLPREVFQQNPRAVTSFSFIDATAAAGLSPGFYEAASFLLAPHQTSSWTCYSIYAKIATL